MPLLDNVKEILLKNKSDGIIFDQNGEYMCQSYFDFYWREYRKKTGLTITAHQLRHTFATFMFESGLSPKESQHILGHSEIATTMNIYTHYKNSQVQNALKVLNNNINR